VVQSKEFFRVKARSFQNSLAHDRKVYISTEDGCGLQIFQAGWWNGALHVVESMTGSIPSFSNCRRSVLRKFEKPKPRGERGLLRFGLPNKVAAENWHSAAAMDWRRRKAAAL
jgi:hypothetical protein